MNKYPSLKRIQKKRQADKWQMACIHAFLAVFRAAMRVWEHVGPPKRRQRVRQLREKMVAIETDKQTVLTEIKTNGVSKGMDALHEMQTKYANTDRQDTLNQNRANTLQSRANILAMRQESEDLQNIHKAAEGDKNIAAQGYREYINTHPSSSFAHSYLGGVLEQLDDLEGSATEYREAIRLAHPDSIRGFASRLELGKLLRKQGQKDAAIAEFQNIIQEATPKTEMLICQAFLELGISLNEIGNRQDARAAWKQAIHWDTTKIAAKQAREMLQANP